MANPNETAERAEELRQGYSRGFRGVEIGSIALYALGLAFVAWRGHAAIRRDPWIAAAGLAAAYLAADFISGLVHWLADTWGRVDMPVIGRTLLRPFRLHHVDQKDITRHDWIETNGTNCAISLPGIALSLVCDWSHRTGLFFGVFWAGVVIFVMLTNQFHKWSHMEPGAIGPVVRALQRSRLILSPQHHRRHHAPPFDRCYGITHGWLNGPLDALRFYRLAERVGTAIFGAIPRSDDLGADDDGARAL